MSNPYLSNRFSTAKPHFFHDCNLKDVLVADCVPGSGFTGTKVVATIGPSCQDVPVLCEMLQAGMVGARLDLAKGTLQFHKKTLENLQQAMKITRKLCCILVDTQGRKIMVKPKERIDNSGWSEYEEKYTIKAGQTVVITTRLDAEPTPGAALLPVDFEGFPAIAHPGDIINVGRYLLFGSSDPTSSLSCKVTSVSGPNVVCVAANDAVLEGLLALHVESDEGGLSGSGHLSAAPPLLNDSDKRSLSILAQDNDIDFIALGYTQDAADVVEARTYLDSIGMNSTKIIAKIATRKSLFSFEGILDKADGIIVSRGPLGMDCLPEKMAMLQKTLIKACNLVGKPVLLSRVVDTMCDTPRPTRAEATDVANAVLDGADGFLLGSETVKGKYPVLTVKTVASISRAAEKVFDHNFHYEHLMEVVTEGIKHGSSESDLLAGDSDAEEEESSVHEGGAFTGGVTVTASAVAAGGAAPAPGTPTRRAASHLKPPAATATGADGKPPGKQVGFSPGAAPGQNGIAAGGVQLAPGAPTMHSQEALRKSKSVHNVVGLNNVARAMAWSGLDNDSSLLPASSSKATKSDLFKLESLASSAVRTADKIQASLIVVYTHTGQTAQLVAKYRPPMPILTLVVPMLLSDNIHWRLDGRSNARQCLLNRGVLPMLSAPGHSEDVMLEEAVRTAASMGLVKAHDYVVCVQRIHAEYCVKVLSVDQLGHGIKCFPRQRNTTFQALPGVMGTFTPPPAGFHTSGPMVKTDSLFPDELPSSGQFVKTSMMHSPGPSGRVTSTRLDSVGEDDIARGLSHEESGALAKTLSMLPNNL